MKKAMKSWVEEEYNDMVLVSHTHEMEDTSKTIESLSQKYKELQIQVEHMANELKKIQIEQYEKNKSLIDFLQSKIDSYLLTQKDIDTVTLGVKKIFHLM